MTAAARWIIDTDVDARTTLGRMADLSVKAMTDPRVIHAANWVISAVEPRNIAAQIEAINDFLNDYFRFVPNPLGTQTIRPPGWTRALATPGMLQDIERRGFTQGACDDAAVLIATLGMANGIPARFRAIAFWCELGAGCDRTPAFTHVIADLFDSNTGQWWELDVTRPADLERPAPQDIARVLLFEI